MIDNAMWAAIFPVMFTAVVLFPGTNYPAGHWSSLFKGMLLIAGAAASVVLFLDLGQAFHILFDAHRVDRSIYEAAKKTAHIWLLIIPAAMVSLGSNMIGAWLRSGASTHAESVCHAQWIVGGGRWAADCDRKGRKMTTIDDIVMFRATTAAAEKLAKNPGTGQPVYPRWGLADAPPPPVGQIIHYEPGKCDFRVTSVKRVVESDSRIRYDVLIDLV